MNTTRSCKAALHSGFLLIAFLMAFAQNASAWLIEPDQIQESEGAVIPLKIVIEATDWVRPDDNSVNRCAAIGINAAFVATYYLKRVSQTADFGSSATKADLHVTYSGVPGLDVTMLWCSPARKPSTQWDHSVTLHLHEDDITEAPETAKLEIWNVDLDGKKTLARTALISITDGGSTKNTNKCSSTALAGNAPVAAGSISAADCDDSPRGAGYLADRFTFSGTQGEFISITSNWDNVDGYLVLQAPNGIIEGESDDYNGKSDSQISGTLKRSGTYTIWATTKDKGEKGDYEISLTGESESPGDWSFTSATAAPALLAQNTSLSISVAGQHNDPSSSAAADGVEVVYLLSADPVMSESDLQLGSESYCCTASFEGAWQGIIDLAPGTYWAGACITTTDDNPANNCTTGTEITVATSLSCNSRTLQCGGTAAGSLGEASCTVGPQGPDFLAEKFTFTGEAGATFWLDADWEFDGYLFLQNPNGQIVAENDNYSGPASSHIEYTLEEGGTYTVWASSYHPAATGSYDVVLGCDRPAGPDLTVDAPALQADAVMPGQRLDLTATLNNAGDQPADSTTLRYVLSSDSRIEVSDPEMGTGVAPSLAAGGASLLHKVTTAPITAGAYWLGVCADRVTNEAALSNNCSAGRRIQVETQVECAKRPMSCGQLLSGTLDSEDCTRSPRGTGFLAEALEVDAEAGSSLVADASWSGFDGYLVVEDPSGFIVASNDDGDALLHSRIEFAVENSGTHRIWTTSFQRGATGSYELELACGSPATADLVASLVEVSSNEVTVEDTIDLSAVVYNAANGASDPTDVHFMLSHDEVISPADTVIASQALASVAAGSSLGAEANVQAPGEPGNYWLGICVDAVNGESLTWNNCSSVDGAEAQSADQPEPLASSTRPPSTGNTGTLVQVSSGAVCSGSVLSCGQNSPGTLQVDDCDRGPRGAGHFSDSYTFLGLAGDTVSLNVDWTGLDGYLYLESPTGGIENENDDFQGLDHSRIEHVLEHSGTYRVWPTAHGQGQSGSYQLSLECNAPSAPDLLVETPLLSASTVRPKQSLTLTTQVLNQGNEGSAGTSMQFFLTNSPIVSPTDRVLGKTDVIALAPGESAPESLSLALDVVPGTYWVAACVDSAAQELDSADNCAVSGPLTVEQNNRPIDINTGLNDAWYDPAANGQGFFISVFPDGQQMFLSWFTYDLDRPDSSVPFELGEPGHRWLTALGTYERGVANLDIYLSQGGVFDQSQPVPTESLYGSMTVSFSDCNHGQVEFDIPSVGEYGVIPITRVATDNLSVCGDKVGVVEAQPEETSAPMNADENAASAAFELNPGLNDAWYNRATTGQGFSFSVFPRLGSVFLSWFTYDTEPLPEGVPARIGDPGLRWLTALGKLEGDRAELTLYRVAGGVFNSGEPAPVETEYGTVTLRFDDCNSGELQYDIPSLSRQGVVPIQRIAPDSIPECERAQTHPDDGLLELAPENKEVLDNFCAGTEAWIFNWPDAPPASSYLVELWRNDALTPMAFTVSESEFHFEKGTAIPAEHLTGWKWRYTPLYPAFGKSAEYSQVFTFDVAACGQ